MMAFSKRYVLAMMASKLFPHLDKVLIYMNRAGLKILLKSNQLQAYEFIPIHNSTK